MISKLFLRIFLESNLVIVIFLAKMILVDNYFLPPQIIFTLEHIFWYIFTLK